jgi:hypothetical protein
VSEVSAPLGELAGELREGLLALAVGTGLQVMAALMEADVTAACGPKGRHDPDTNDDGAAHADPRSRDLVVGARTRTGSLTSSDR